MNKVTIGIDPGTSGGLAVFDGSRMEAYKMPETFPDIYESLKEIRDTYITDSDIIVYLENVGHGMPGQSSKATATFARHNGHLEMALYALGMRTEMVTPQKWMKYYSNSLGKSSDCEKKEWKNKLKCEAQRLFPSVKVTLWNADAILIANYGYKK